MTLEEHINKALKGLFVDGDKDNSWGTDEKTEEIMNLIKLSNINRSSNLEDEYKLSRKEILIDIFNHQKMNVDEFDHLKNLLMLKK